MAGSIRGVADKLEALIGGGNADTVAEDVSGTRAAATTRATIPPRSAKVVTSKGERAPATETTLPLSGADVQDEGSDDSVDGF